jgi:hypothetical protein
MSWEVEARAQMQRPVRLCHLDQTGTGADEEAHVTGVRSALGS